MSLPDLTSFTRRGVLAGGLAAATAVAMPGLVRAQNWPVRPLRIVVPYPPGGAADVVARLYAHKLGEALGQTVIVENRAGGATAIAAETVAASPADGYTLSLVPTGQVTVLPHLVRTLRFDPFKSFTPISLLAATGVVVAAAPSTPVSSLADLVALAKRKPGEVTYSTSGTGTIIHLAGEYFSLTADIKLLHVPFKGSAPAVTALLGGEIATAFDTLTVLAPQIAAGKVKGLAIASPERSPLLPDVPTVAESGYPGFEVTSWFGLSGPAGLPPEVTARLGAEIAAIAAKTDVRDTLAAQGLTPTPSTPEAFTARIRADHATFARVVTDAKLALD